MELRVDGSRSTNESWVEAYRVPVQELPPLTEEEQQVAQKLSISFEDYRRSKYATDLTRLELQEKALSVGTLVQRWLAAHEIPAKVVSVWLKTFDGRFRVDAELRGRVRSIFLTEDLIDDLLEAGSIESHNSFDRTLTANFNVGETARAS